MAVGRRRPAVGATVGPVAGAGGTVRIRFGLAAATGGHDGPVGFVLVVGGVLLLVHLYLYWRLVRSTGTGRAWRIGGAVVLALLFLTFLTAVATQRSGPWQQITVLHLVGNVWVALLLYLTLVLLVAEVVRGVLLLVRRARHTSTTPQRRRAYARGAAVTAGVVAAGTVGYGITQAFAPITVVQATVVVPGLPAEFDGYRIGLATDLHLGAISRAERTREVVDILAAQDVDVATFVGDLVDGTPDELAGAVAPLDVLTGPDGPPDGVLFTTGNHEYYSDAPAWEAVLADRGLTVLANAGMPVTRDGARIWIAGVNDYTGSDFGDPADVAAALQGRQDGDVTVLMAHQPRQIEMAAAAGVDLQLAGHTHGGQVWPFHYAVLAQQGTLAGLSRLGDTQLWTSRGAGFWGPPVRVGAPSDVSILTLTAA